LLHTQGHSRKQIAELIGVAPETISVWKRHSQWQRELDRWRELAQTPLIGAVIEKVGHLTVDRVDLSRGVADAERVTRVLREGASLFFFPEATFVRAPGVRQFRLGAFKAAVEAKCAVVPVALRGTRDILPADTWLPHPGPITVTIGEPFMPVGTEWREMVRLRDLARTVIVRGSGETPVEERATFS